MATGNIVLKTHTEDSHSSAAVCPQCRTAQPGLVVKGHDQLYNAENVLVFGYKCVNCGRAVHFGVRAKR